MPKNNKQKPQSNSFKEFRLKTRTLGEMVIPKLVQIEGEDNPKKRLLKELNREISGARGDNIRNRTIGAGKLKIKAASAPKDMGQRDNKTRLDNASNLGAEIGSQRVNMLKEIRDYIEKTPSDSFDFNSLNKGVARIYKHFQDKVTTLNLTQNTKYSSKLHEQTKGELYNAEKQMSKGNAPKIKRKQGMFVGKETIDRLKTESNSQREIADKHAIEVAEHIREMQEYEKRNPRPKFTPKAKPLATDKVNNSKPKIDSGLKEAKIASIVKSVKGSAKSFANILLGDKNFLDVQARRGNKGTQNPKQKPRDPQR